MNISIPNNFDFLTVIQCPQDKLQSMEQSGLFQKNLALSEGVWLTKCSNRNFGRIKELCKDEDSFSILKVRYTHGSEFFSANNALEATGRLVLL
ncbi:MAG: hypothetical protein OCC49_01085 [Fibrobacterales bacterium]